MADLADILGVDKQKDTASTESKPKKAAKNNPYAKLPRYMRDILDENNPLPEDLLQEKKSRTLLVLLVVEVEFSKKPAQKWDYTEFSNSARSDGVKFRHWARHNVEQPDYPFARFNTKVKVITYTRLYSVNE